MTNKKRPNAKATNARDRVLKTAIGIFAQKGYAGTSVREIADQAGVSKPVLYYYFKSKEGLFLAILEMAENLQKKLLADVLESQGNVLDRLLMLYRRVYSEVAAHQSLYKMIHGLIFGPPQGTPPYDFTRYHRHMINAICKIYDSGIAGNEVKKSAGEEVAYLVLSLIDFCLHMDQVKPQSADPQRPERLLRLAFEGIDKKTVK
ncbi:MAG: TetR/AcrR family transcriptional regulator [Desulfobacterales bacterium]|jgi:AcrR family transcriptional regulator|nr:TetR/AcrR family transcriptional regulator [Deltaproteobacteria bacterium]